MVLNGTITEPLALVAPSSQHQSQMVTLRRAKPTNGHQNVHVLSTNLNHYTHRSTITSSTTTVAPPIQLRSNGRTEQDVIQAIMVIDYLREDVELIIGMFKSFFRIV